MPKTTHHNHFRHHILTDTRTMSTQADAPIDKHVVFVAVFSIVYTCPDNEMYGVERHLHTESASLVNDDDDLILEKYWDLLDDVADKIAKSDMLNKYDNRLEEEGSVRDNLQVIIGKAGEICSCTSRSRGVSVHNVVAKDFM
jgi:hypothetical protein